SSTTVSTRLVDSNTSGPLMRIPNWAPRPVPTSRAVGVANPSAQGQAMINTATEAVNAIATGLPLTNQNTRVATAKTITIGTNTAEIRSANRCTAALPVCASSTSLANCANLVSDPTPVARTTNLPFAFTVAPATVLPVRTSVGTDSPVSMLSSTAELPCSTTPSVAIFSPGRTTNRSPTTSSWVAIGC